MTADNESSDGRGGFAKRVAAVVTEVRDLRTCLIIALRALQRLGALTQGEDEILENVLGGKKRG